MRDKIHEVLLEFDDLINKVSKIETELEYLKGQNNILNAAFISIAKRLENKDTKIRDTLILTANKLKEFSCVN